MKKRMFLVWFVFAPAVAAFFLYIIHNIKWMSLDSPNLPSIDYSRLEFAKIESNSNIDNAIRNAVGSADSQNIPESSKNKLVDSIENLLLAYSEGTWDAFRAFRYPIDDQFVCTTSSFHNDTFISNSYRPYNCNLTPGGWRDFLDYANGTLGDWEVHWLDQVLWWTKEKHPRTVYSSGGRPVLGKAVATPVEATTDAPGTQVAVYQLESFTATWEHRRYSANVSERHRIGASFHGTNGVFHMGWRDGWAFYPRDQKEQPVHEAPRFSDDTDGNNLRELWIDFLEAIDEKRLPVAHMEATHRSSLLPLLGMISMKVRRSLSWDGSRERILDDPQASALVRREFRPPWEYPQI